VQMWSMRILSSDFDVSSTAVGKDGPGGQGRYQSRCYVSVTVMSLSLSVAPFQTNVLNISGGMLPRTPYVP